MRLSWNEVRARAAAFAADWRDAAHRRTLTTIGTTVTPMAAPGCDPALHDRETMAWAFAIWRPCPGGRYITGSPKSVP